MALTRYKLGYLIEQSFEKNKKLYYSINDVRGISTDKKMIPTKADMNGVPLNNYLLMKPNYFAYVSDTSRRGDKISLCFNDTEKTYICSSISTCFYVCRTDILDPYFLFMFFNRPEFDRYARYNSWGSARETFDWTEMCNIEIQLPPLEIQKKYVAVYTGMKKNQSSYSKRIDDLKLSSEATIERMKNDKKHLKGYIEKITQKNESDINNVIGISNKGFIEPKNQSKSLKNYNVVTNGCFVYNPSAINLGSIELYNKEDIAVCSPIYIVFRVKDDEKLNKDYLNIWLHREEFFRLTEYYSLASVRNNFTFDLMEEISISIPKIETQNSLAKMCKALYKSKKINDDLEKQLKKMCSILIKGAQLEEN